MECIFAKTIYTGKSILSNRYLVFEGPNITGVSTSQRGTLVGEYAVLTPAFIDPHSHIGMERSGEPKGEGEANDHLDSILALSDALDPVQMDDKAFRDAVELGVLYSCVVPGSGNIIGGFFAELGCQFPQFPFIAHTRGWSAEDMENNESYVRDSKFLHEGAAALVRRSADMARVMIESSLGHGALVRGGRKGDHLDTRGGPT